MEPPTWFRLGAAVLGLALLAAALAIRDPDVPEPTRAPPAVTPTDPLAVELARCRDLGLEAASDPACKEVWAKNRARFFSPRSAPMER